MIDIHTHILPGIDDGARDLEDSIEMAAIAAHSGVHTLVATSHANTQGFFREYSVNTYMERLFLLRKALNEEKIPLEVLSGMEIFMSEEVPDMIREERLLPINGTDYFLMEFGFGIEQEEMDDLLDQVMELSLIPIIAHPERYRCVQESAKSLFYWMEQGCLTQVNRGSIFGRFGEKAKMCVDHLLEKRMVSAIASDAHKPYERTTYMADIKEYMERQYSFEYSKELLYDNPRKILKGERIIKNNRSKET